MHEHKPEEWPKVCHPREQQDRHAANELTDSQETLGGEIAIDELRADEHSHERCQIERSKDERLLPGVETEPLIDVTEIQFEPSAPNEKLQEHHDAEARPNEHGLARW